MEASSANLVTDADARGHVRGMTGWMKFLGIVNIVGGALNALSIIGILWAWLPIWVGIVLMQASSRAGEYAERGDAASLGAFMGRLKTYFAISGIAIIISLALSVISVIAVVVLMAAGLWSMPSLLEALNQ
jgi:hypothetical protein